MVIKKFCNICGSRCDEDFIDIDIYERKVYAQNKIIMKSKHIEICPNCYAECKQWAAKIASKTKHRKNKKEQVIEDD